MMKRVLSILILLFLFSQNSQAQELRLYGGLGANKDVAYHYGVDFSYYFFENSSRFNAGGIAGLYYNHFDEPRLATNELFFYHVGFRFKYKIFEKTTLFTDFGKRIPFNDDNYNFNDPSGNPIPNTNLESHFFITPSIDYAINKTLSVFLYYNIAFENELDMNAIGIGISIKY